MSALSLSFALARPVQADEPVAANRRLPKTTLAFVSLRSVGDLKKKWAESLMGKLAEDPAVADFRGEVEKKIKEVGDQAQEQLGLSLSELLTIPQGELTAAVVTTKAKPALIALLDFGDGKEAVLKLLEKASSRFNTEGAKRTEEEVEGDELVIFNWGANEEQDGAKAKAQSQIRSLAWCIKGTTLIVGSSTESVKSVLRFWDGTNEACLAEQPVYRYIAQRCQEEEGHAVIEWYVDPIGIVNAGAASAGGQAGFVIAAIPMLGLNGLRGAGGTVDMVAGDYDMVSRTLIYMDQPARGAMNLFQFPATNLTPPKWVSKDAATYYALNWDIEKAWKAVGNLYDQYAPLLGAKGKFTDLIDRESQNKESGNLHYKKDIVDQLSGRIHFLTQETADPAKPKYLLAFELKDPAAFEKSLSKITSHPGFPAKPRDFRGTKVWDLDNEGGVEFALSITQRCLMLTFDKTLLEQIVRGGDEPLTESPEFQRVSKKFPSETASLGYSRKDQFKSTYETLRKMAGDEENENDIDYSKLPKYEVLEKYLAPGGSFVAADPKGLFWTTFTLKND